MTTRPDTHEATLIVETVHWRLGYRRDSRYPGLLTLSSQQAVSDFNTLDAASLAELGQQLGFAEKLLQRCYAPYRVVFYKLGFSAGFSLHVHIAPISHALLNEIAAHPSYSDDPDGNDAILYLSREYGERDLGPEEQQTQRIEIVRLREMASQLLRQPSNFP